MPWIALFNLLSLSKKYRKKETLSTSSSELKWCEFLTRIRIKSKKNRAASRVPSFFTVFVKINVLDYFYTVVYVTGVFRVKNNIIKIILNYSTTRLDSDVKLYSITSKLHQLTDLTSRARYKKVTIINILHCIQIQIQEATFHNRFFFTTRVKRLFRSNRSAPTENLYW